MSVPVTLSVIRDEHQALSALLQSLAMLVRQGPGDDAGRFFESVRAMLFYIDEFPERIHHPKESESLFPRVALRSPQTCSAIARLDQDHHRGEAAVRELQHLLLAWELLGEGRRAAFTEALARYVGFYLEHMRIEEREILPAAEATLTAQDWSELDLDFGANRDPLTGCHPPTEQYEKLFQRIAREAPAPIGLGD